MKRLKLWVITLVAMSCFTACNNDCGHDFIEHDYTKDLVGTWSIIGPDAAEALVIKADGTMEFTGVHDGEFLETTARYEVVNNRMTIIWEDGTVDKGRLDVVAGSVFSMIVDEETGAGYYFTYCYEDLSDKLVGSWLVQSDETSEIHTYYEDGRYCRKSQADKWIRQGISNPIEIVTGHEFVTHPDWHSPNWCTAQEMEQCVTQLFFRDGEWIGDYFEWKILSDVMKLYEESGEYECRAVFWFDN